MLELAVVYVTMSGYVSVQPVRYAQVLIREAVTIDGLWGISKRMTTV